MQSFPLSEPGEHRAGSPEYSPEVRSGGDQGNNFKLKEILVHQQALPMCMCANAIREPTQTLTGTGTGTPPIIVMIILRLAMFITASVCHATGIFQSAFYHSAGSSTQGLRGCERLQGKRR